jgi:ABC-type multidrug transport system ATPase subunit
VVLNGISFTLDEGKTLALLGRNGTGKTTLINTLAGATRQHGGTITLGAARRCTSCLRTSAPRPASAGCRRSATSSSR